MRFPRRGAFRVAACALGMAVVLVGFTGSNPFDVSAGPHLAPVGAAGTGISKIKHVVVIMQENRSFDSYFGTYPGADGIPMVKGVPSVCVPDAVTKTCIKPYHDSHDVMQAGPHGNPSFVADLDGGRMDGFVNSVAYGHSACGQLATPNCVDGPNNSTDVMGYKTCTDIPNYCAYAKYGVLQDHMFEPNASWSLPEHLFMVSGWAANCANHNPSSCVNAVETPGPTPINQDPTNAQPYKGAPIYAWTDLTYLLHKYGVSWRYYVTSGNEPDCQNPQAMSCGPVSQSSRTLGIWNPLPYFDTVRADNQLGNIQSVSSFYAAAKAGTLPAVSWVVPSGDVSEHPPSTTSAGQSVVTSEINAIMGGPDWSSTAIFVSWDDWGGFYDGVVPPTVDANGYGFRVPGLLISPYARHGYIDHQTLSFDAYLKFIEDDFLDGQRINPKTDGRPDPRPDVRENASVLGDLLSEFDFTQTPRAPMLLPVQPQTTLTNRPPFQPLNVTATPGSTTVSLTWSLPLSDGGSPITGYQVTPYLAGVARPVRRFDAGASSGVVSGLINGNTYTFAVAAVNQLGVGVQSPVPALTVGAPPAPAGASAAVGTVAGTVQITLVAPPYDNGATITGYTVTPYVNGVARTVRNIASTASTVTIAGLARGTTYTFDVAAVNSRGAGPPAVTNSVVPN